MSDYLDPNNEELLKDFFIEAEMQVDGLEQNILVLEKDPSDRDAIDEIFRAAHTLKGAAATVQMTKLSEFTHLVEDVLDAIRSNEVTTDESVVDILLNSIDVIKALLEAQKQGEEYDEDISELKESLRGLLSKEKPVEAAPPKKAKSSAPTESPTKGAEKPGEASGVLSEYDRLELMEAAEAETRVLRVKVEFNEDHPMNTIGGIQVFAALKDLGTVLKTEPEFELLYEDNFYP
ncbi:MAG TPA: chemotaxis protein CheA, partial [Sediminispirochaeta sp.]|nr:chemotaxis protein CheA [Sediminispirochaeta sp.]